MPEHCDRRSDEESGEKDRRRLVRDFFRASLERSAPPRRAVLHGELPTVAVGIVEPQPKVR
jgi:hypothetical protein